MPNERQTALDLGVVGNCEIAALIDARASLVWMCLPRPDADPVFSALLTRDLGKAANGVFAIDMVDVTATEQHYIRNTAILETVLRDAHGNVCRVVDFCPRFRARGRMFRPVMFMRSVEPVSGRPMLRLRLRPTSGYGAEPTDLRRGSHHLRFTSDGVGYRCTTDASINAILESRPLLLHDPLTFIIGPDESIEETPAVLVRRFMEETRTYWLDWVRTLAIPYDFQEEVIRAAITLKLCAYEDTGAVMAALTTSVPESANSGRNWDYRYCWLRDAYFVVQALNRLGATRTMEGYLHYIDHVVATSGPSGLQPLYKISGDTDLEERTIDTLEGFLGMGPVRVGNQAANQKQNDVYGAVILAATQLFFDHRLAQPGDALLFQRLEAMGERAAAVYEQPDAGPWEFRGVEHSHTFSAAVSWAGCDRLARIAAQCGYGDSKDRWRRTADAMRERILERAWNQERQAFVASFGGRELDAAILLLPELGLVAPHDPRFLSTLQLIDRELREGDLLFRYRHPDDFGKPETAFVVCAFWYVNALAAAGHREQAREQFQRLLTLRNPLGLFSEDIHPSTGTLWGNYPQTYSLVGIINSALRLSRSWEDAL